MHQVPWKTADAGAFLNLTLGEWSSWEEVVKFREDKIFSQGHTCFKGESQREEKLLTCMCFREWKDIQLDRLGEFREGLKVICGAEYLELEDRETS